MNKSIISKRSFEKINKGDLKRLLKIANEDRNEFFLKHPIWEEFYSDRMLCIALFQGAAQHYIDKKNGVKDFDVWTFYEKIHLVNLSPAGEWGIKILANQNSGYIPLTKINLRGGVSISLVDLSAAHQNLIQ